MVGTAFNFVLWGFKVVVQVIVRGFLSVAKEKEPRVRELLTEYLAGLFQVSPDQIEWQVMSCEAPGLTSLVRTDGHSIPDYYGAFFDRACRQTSESLQ